VGGALAHFNGSLGIPVLRELKPLPKVFVDGEQISKVLVNLVLNAKEAPGTNQIEITSETLEGWIIVSVKDNGCGMSTDFLSRSLFKPFQTTKSKGTGIGLFQCKKIIEAHRGRIEVESAEGLGSTFKVMIPVRTGRSAAH